MIDIVLEPSEESGFLESSILPESSEVLESGGGEVLPESSELLGSGGEEGQSEIVSDGEPLAVTSGSMIEIYPRPFLTTPFSEYSVTEGLLLFILLGMCGAALFKLIKGVF